MDLDEIQDFDSSSLDQSTDSTNHDLTRRDLLKKSSLLGGALMVGSMLTVTSCKQDSGKVSGSNIGSGGKGNKVKTTGDTFHNLIELPQASQVERFFNPMFSIENPIGPSPKAMEIVGQIPPLYHRYGMQNYFEDNLKKDLSSQMGVASESIFFAPGSTETLRMLVRTLTSVKHPVVMSSNEYGFMYMHAKDYKSKVETVPLRSDFKVDLDALLKHKNKAGFLYLSNPHLPLGRVHGANDLEKFIKAAAPTIVVVDECYINFLGGDKDGSHNQGHERFSVAPLVKKYQNLVVTRTFSKVYGLAALRVGYHAVSRALWGKLDLRTRQMSPLSVAAANAALFDEEHIKLTLSHCDYIRDKVISFAKSKGVKYIEDSRTPFFSFLFNKQQAMRLRRGRIGTRKVEMSIASRKSRKGGEVYYQMITLAREKEVDNYLALLGRALG